MLCEITDNIFSFPSIKFFKKSQQLAATQTLLRWPMIYKTWSKRSTQTASLNIRAPAVNFAQLLHLFNMLEVMSKSKIWAHLLQIIFLYDTIFFWSVTYCSDGVKYVPISLTDWDTNSQKMISWVNLGLLEIIWYNHFLSAPVSKGVDEWVASLMSFMASLVTTSRMQQCFNVMCISCISVFCSCVIVVFCRKQNLLLLILKSLRSSDTIWCQRSLSPLAQVKVCYRAINWTNADLLSTGLLEIWIKIPTFFIREKAFKISFAKRQSFFPEPQWTNLLLVFEIILCNHFSSAAAPKGLGGLKLISPLDKMAAILQMIFQMYFHEWKVLYFYENFTKVCSLGSNRQ